MSAPEIPAWLLPPVVWQGPPAVQTHSEPRPLSHTELLEFRDSMHEDSVVYAAGGAEIDLWLAQLDEAIDAGLVDPRPSWEIEAAEQAERVAAIVVERLRERTPPLPRPEPAKPKGSEHSLAPVLTLVPSSRPEILTLEQVAELLQVSHPTIRKVVREEGLPCTFVGKQYRFRRGDVDRWLERRKERARGCRRA